MASAHARKILTVEYTSCHLSCNAVATASKPCECHRLPSIKGSTRLSAASRLVPALPTTSSVIPDVSCHPSRRECALHDLAFMSLDELASYCLRATMQSRSWDRKSRFLPTQRAELFCAAFSHQSRVKHFVGPLAFGISSRTFGAWQGSRSITTGGTWSPWLKTAARALFPSFSAPSTFRQALPEGGLVVQVFVSLHFHKHVDIIPLILTVPTSVSFNLFHAL